MTEVVCNSFACIFNEDGRCVSPCIEVVNETCFTFIYIDEENARYQLDSILRRYYKNLISCDELFSKLYGIYIWSNRNNESEVKERVLEVIKEEFPKCKFKSAKLRNTIASVIFERRKRKGIVKDIIINILKEREWFYRFELRNYGIDVGGSLTRTLRKLESEGIIKIVDDVVEVGSTKQRVKKIMRGYKFNY